MEDLTWRVLEQEKLFYLRQALAESTKRTYNVGVNHYYIFCQQTMVVPFPLHEAILEDFVVSLARRVGYRTLKVYLCGIQFASHVKGLPQLIIHMARLRIILRGIRKAQKGSHLRQPKIPVSPNHIRRTLAFIQSKYSARDGNMLSAAVLLAFFGMLRVSEYTAPTTTTFEPALHLGVNDVTLNFSSHIVSIHLSTSKTDPFCAGVDVRVGATFNDICPFTALTRYLAKRTGAGGPLFVFSDGRYLVRSHITYVLRAVTVNPASTNTHSLRMGGASSLAMAGVPRYTIQLLGRWASDAYKRYIFFNDAFIAKTNTIMSRL